MDLYSQIKERNNGMWFSIKDQHGDICWFVQRSPKQPSDDASVLN